MSSGHHRTAGVTIRPTILLNDLPRPRSDHTVTASYSPRHLFVSFGLFKGLQSRRPHLHYLVQDSATGMLDPTNPGPPASVDLRQFPGQQVADRRFAECHDRRCVRPILRHSAIIRSHVRFVNRPRRMPPGDYLAGHLLDQAGFPLREPPGPAVDNRGIGTSTIAGPSCDPLPWLPPDRAAAITRRRLGRPAATSRPAQPAPGCRPSWSRHRRLQLP